MNIIVSTYKTGKLNTRDIDKSKKAGIISKFLFGKYIKNGYLRRHCCSSDFYIMSKLREIDADRMD